MFVAAITGLILTGTLTQFGQSFPFELAAASDGSFDWRKEGPAGERLVWNGRDGWRVDADGRVMPLEMFDLESARLGAWLLAGTHLDWPMEARADTLAVPSGRLRATTRRGDDRRITRMEWPSVSGPVTWSVREGGLWDQRLGDILVESYEIAASGPANLDAARFAEPPAPPDDWTWLPGVSDTLEIRRAGTGHLLVHPRVNGKDAGWFIFDTGAGESIITPNAAALLDLPTVGRTVITSILESVECPIHRADTLDLGPLRIHARRLVAMDMSPFEAVLGAPIGGVLGGEVLSRVLVAVETEGPRIILHRPGTLAVAAADWRPLRFNQRLPLVVTDFSGASGELFRIDVGAAGGFGTVAFHSPAVARLRLLEGKDWERFDMAGMTFALGPLDWFDLGGRRFEDETLVFVETADGPMADPWVTGNIGVELLKPFVTVFDCANRRIAFLPR